VQDLLSNEVGETSALTKGQPGNELTG
jgi:hypothetical protein